MGIITMANSLALAGPNSKYQLPGAKPAGFWAGIWHGILAPVVFFISLFNSDVSIYEMNHKRSYNIGFILAVAELYLPLELFGNRLIAWVALLLIIWQACNLIKRDRILLKTNEELTKLNQKLEQKSFELEKANQEILEANRLKSDFLARMSHDLRTPMNAIIGYTRILRRKTQDALDARQQRNLENIQVSADHLLRLINDILDLSKIEAGRIDVKLEEVDLQQLAEECIGAVASLVKPGVRLERQIGDAALVYTDPDRVHRALMNLLSNAIKFTEEGGITLSLRMVNEWVELSVADTGIGIPAADLPHIFDEFRQVERQGTTKKEGTGLGLAIAKKSAELMGGTIAVESKIGRGTTFTLMLPIDSGKKGIPASPRFPSEELAAPSSSESPPLVAPDREELAALLDSAKRGHVSGIEARADKLERRDTAMVPFARRLRQLTQDFKIRELQSFINQFME